MTRLFFERVRRSLGRSSEIVPASALPPAVEGRPDDYRLADGRLLEDRELTAHPVAAEPCREPLAFLDGVQRYEVVGYLETHPIVTGIVAAAVRLRTDGSFRTVERAERRVLVASAELLPFLADLTEGLEPIAVEAGKGPVHPLKELETAQRAIDAARAGLERALGVRFRRAHPDAWLVVDGVLPDEEQWATDLRAIGVSKSHGTLPFSGLELPRYLRLPMGHRSSVFVPETGRASAVHSWGLRLWPHEGRDLLHGLVRVEVGASDDFGDRADRIASWLMAERVPLARPDARWDRLLYGVATVERHLKAQ